jgi:chromosomal replication initiator protein DnaA
MSNAHAHVWRAAQERLRHQLKRAEYDTWLRDTRLAVAGDGSAVLRVRTTFACELVKSRYRDLIETALAEVTGQPLTLRVAVMTGSESGAEEEDPDDTRVPPRSTHLAATRSAARRVYPTYAGPTLFGPDDAPRDVPARAESSPPRSPRTLQARVRAAAAARPPASSQPESGTPHGSNLEAKDSGDPARDTSIHRAPVGASHDRGALDGMATMERQGPADEDWEDVSRSMAESRERIAPNPYAEAAASSAGMAIPAPRLNPRYTFSTFIVGSGNQLAHAASLAVAEAPGQAYNPLFLYGGVGLGKTHLLHAIGHTAVERDQTVLYVSSETFTNEIINAIRYRTTEEFRAKYRSADVLLVDDIQFIAGKESTEEEFFHTFNSLYETNRQIVICSDRPPKAIVALAERLRSRFEWGLIADIQPPDLETRVAILRAKADMLGRHVPDDVILFLASRVHSNIRELEGGFNRLLAFSQLQGLPLTIEMAKAALASLAEDGRQRRVGVDDVLQAVAEHYRISIEDLRGKQRDKHIVVPRQIAMYLMRQETEASLLEIGQALGGRDHSTVLHGCDKINREVNENASLRKEVLSIRQQLIG